MSGLSPSGYPYALGSDALTDWPTTSAALAARLEPIVPWTPITLWGPGWGPWNPGDSANVPSFMVGADRRVYLRGLVKRNTTPDNASICDLSSSPHTAAIASEAWMGLMSAGAAGSYIGHPVGLATTQSASLIHLATGLPQGFTWQTDSWISLSGGGWSLAPWATLKDGDE